MSLILQIETATTCCSVAVAKNGVVLAHKEIDERNIHAAVITRFIEAVMAEAAFNYDDLDAVAVSSGPGSYTGLRIGISTAKGLCFAIDKPLIAIETLEAMANGAKKSTLFEADNNILLCPMIDARRMEVFTAIYSKEGYKLLPTSALIIDEESFQDKLALNKILFFGDGAQKCAHLLQKSPNALFLPAFVNSAVDLTEKALQKFTNGDFEDVAYFEPYYLKEFIAGKKAS